MNIDHGHAGDYRGDHQLPDPDGTMPHVFGARTVRLSDVEPEAVSWLWPGYLPRGKLVILDGDPGVAKSTVCLDLAARVSAGAPMPDGTGGGRPADVLLLSAEDGLADTIRPRLGAAGADVTRVHALTEVAELREDGRLTKRPASLPADLPEVERIIRESQVALVIVDLLMAYLAGAVDAHRDQDVRRVLHQLAGIADRHRCTVVVVRHLNKAGGHTPSTAAAAPSASSAPPVPPSSSRTTRTTRPAPAGSWPR